MTKFIEILHSCLSTMKNRKPTATGIYAEIILVAAFKIKGILPFEGVVYGSIVAIRALVRTCFPSCY